MPPSEYSFRLQKGIVGGFAPPTPDAIVTLTRVEGKDNVNLTHAKREPGQPSLTELAPKSLSNKEVEHLVDELYTILKDLPVESPPGSEDIYGLNTSIAWGSDDLQWYNGGPQGCGGGSSSIQATDEQKAKFKRAVAIVEKLAD